MQKVLKPLRVGAVVEGFGVPHAHIHLVPLYDAEALKLHHGYSVKKSKKICWKSLKNWLNNFDKIKKREFPTKSVDSR